jgi:hypothetical protein
LPPSITISSPSRRTVVAIADRSLPATGSLNPTPTSVPSTSRGSTAARVRASACRATVQAAMPCAVITLRTDPQWTPTAAVSSPLSTLDSPGPP